MKPKTVVLILLSLSLILPTISMVQANYYQYEYWDEIFYSQNTCIESSTQYPLNMKVVVTHCHEDDPQEKPAYCQVTINRGDGGTWSYFLYAGQSTPTISGNGYSIVVHVAWEPWYSGYHGEHCKGYIKWQFGGED